MLSSKLLATGATRSRFSNVVDAFFHRLSERYDRSLRHLMERPWLVVGGMLAVMALAALLFRGLPSELAPAEDRGMAYIGLTGPEGATLEYMDRHGRMVEDILMAEIADGEVVRAIVRVPGGFGGGAQMNQARGFMLLKPWGEREHSAEQIAQRIRTKLNQIPGVRTFVGTPGGWTVSSGSPVQVVLGGTEYADLVQWRDRLMARMEENPGLSNIQSNFEERKPQIRIAVDRDRAADLGVSLQTVGRTLETVLGSRIVTTFIERDREYNVILQGRAEDRATPADLDSIYVRSDRTSELIPLSNLVRLTEVAGATTLNRFDRLRAITISAELEAGYTLGEALDFVEGVVEREMPPAVRLNYDGQSREYKDSGGRLYFMFVLALVVVFLVLAMQFESFLHPFVIMTTVPLAVTGALLGLWFYGMSINVFSQIAAIMLVGLAAKNGILIVEFANQRRDAGLSVREAILDAAATRMRPILMTSIATIAGALPLMLATGAGAGSRTSIGVVVVFGVALSTFLSLFVVPTFYLLLAPFTRPPDERTQKLDALEREIPSVDASPHA
jgi:multidrug efflux pump